MTIEVSCVSKTVHTVDAEGAVTLMVQFQPTTGIGSFHYYLSTTDAAVYDFNAKFNLTLAAV